jgi:O-antigen/teichoic acid export membrane protein
MFITPVFNAVFPRLSALVAGRAEAELRDVYHRAAQALAVLVLPLGTALAWFPWEAVFLWTGRAETATQTAPLLRLLAAGTMLNGLLHLPYALQLAHGWTRFGLFLGASSVLVLVPAVYVLASAGGAAGAAWAWPLLNGASLLIGVWATHGRLLPGEGLRGWARDVALPLAASNLVAGLARLGFPEPASRGESAFRFGIVCLGAYALAGLAAPAVRRGATESIFRRAGAPGRTEGP